MTAVRVEHLSKYFDRTAAVDGIDLEIAPGELFFLLGPSGCGKTTLLRLIAGLQQPTSGKIFFNDRDVTQLGTEKRNAVMCFQSYALWPHMSVRDNVQFGLEVRGLSSTQRRDRVDEMLSLVQLTGYADRKPNELSGGQQQRVALARALAVEPACLLLDEPLSNLDATLRQEMRGEIRRICKTAGCTTIYVTHDQKEALSIADRIALMKDGKLAQVGTPGDLYERPASAFVASFVTNTNLMKGKIVSRHGETATIQTDHGSFNAVLPANMNGTADLVTLSIRPQQMRVSAEARQAVGDQVRIAGRLIESSFQGESSEHVIQAAKQKFRVVATPPMFDLPAEVSVEFDPRDIVVLTK